MIVAEPTLTATAPPVVGLMVITAVLELLQVPPVVASVNVMVSPTQKVDLEVIGDGAEFTVTFFVLVVVPQLLVTV